MPIGRPGKFVFGPFRLDTTEHSLTRQGGAIPLAPKSFDLLWLLVANAGSLVEKDRIMQSLWPDTFVEESNLSNLVALLRRSLGDSPSQPEYIQTVPKRGYRFIAKVEDAPTHSKGATQSFIATASPRAIRVIAFPFRANGSVTGVDHLAFGLPDSISSLLSDLNAFIVRSVQVAMRFDPVQWDPKIVAEQADIDVILCGTYSRQASRLQVLTQLMEARTGALLWSKTWDLETVDAFRLPEAVVQMIVRTLLHGEKYQEYAPKSLSGGSESFHLFTRANQLALKRTPENMAHALDLYLAAVEKDPAYAPAWAGLGRCYRFLDKFAPQPGRQIEAAKAAFERAFSIDPDLGIAHALYTGLQVDLGAAEQAMVRLLKRAATHGNDPEVFSGLVHACRYCGLLEQSLAAHQCALQLDRNIKTSVAHTYFALGDYERALFWYGAEAGLYLDALALACTGREPEAAAMLWSRRDKFSLMPVAMPSLQAYLDGDLDRCISILQQLPSGSTDPEMRFYAARQAAVAGAIALANRLLAQSVEQGYLSSHTMEHDPWFENIRHTSEFKATQRVSKCREEKARTSFEQWNHIGLAPPL